MQDAHSHLADPSISPIVDQLISESKQHGIDRSVVNGTCEDDWPQVIELYQSHPDFITPSLGLHPWQVGKQSPSWLTTLESHIASHPGIQIGECGLDRWIEGHDIDAQIEAFLPQIDLALRYNRALTIHCLQAWGHLIDLLKTTLLPTRGFLIHAFSGSNEVAHQLSELGAYFSFSPYFLHERKKSLRKIYAKLPFDRLLIETDSPFMPPPMGKEVKKLNQGSHPTNLKLAFSALAEARSEPTSLVSTQLQGNFLRFFQA